jgi:hypothetical protein
VKEGRDVNIFTVEPGESPVSSASATSTEVYMYSLVHDDRYCVVEDTFPKNYGIQLWIHLVLIENSKDRDRVCG